jgi:hypothetical protein
MTAPAVGSWLASLGKGALHSGTIRTYRSALSTSFEVALGAGSNPLEDPRISRIIKGIKRDKLPGELAKRRTVGRTLELTASLLAELAPIAGGDGSAQDIMRWAAACIGSYGMLRPSEFLGVQKNRAAALCTSEVLFYAQAGSQKRVRLCPPGALLEQYAQPDRVALDLGATKADQFAENPPLVIAAAPAVQALWRWMHLRRDLGGADGPVFTVPHGEGPLSCKDLCAHVRDWVSIATGVLVPKVTGRTFRRGGASAMLASGATRPDIQEAGRWRSPAMVDVYSSASAKRERAVMDSRAQGASAAAASSAGGAALHGRAGGAVLH